jgi:hypothetical protein
VIVEKKICNNFKTFGIGKSMKTSKLPYISGNIKRLITKFELDLPSTV